MRIFQIFRQKLGSSDSILRGPTPKEIAQRGRQPVTRDEFYKEGATVRDIFARVDNDLGRLGERLYRLEQESDKRVTRQLVLRKSRRSRW